RSRLMSAGCHNVSVMVGDGADGTPLVAPFDRIVATASVYDISPSWVTQLREGGILVICIWIRGGFQLAISFRKVGDWLALHSVQPVVLLPIAGYLAGPIQMVKAGHLLIRGEAERLDWHRQISSVLRETHRRSPWHSHPPAGWFARLALEQAGAIQ